MDPPTVRVYRKNGANDDDCSPEFDPLGGLILGAPGDRTPANVSENYFPAADDLDTVIENVMLRAFVYDRTNTAPGASSIVYSNVDNSSVQLWFQRDPSVPLLIDTNGDGMCDDINTDPGAGVENPDSYALEPLSLTPSLTHTPKYNGQTFDGFDPFFDPILGPPPYAGCTVLAGDTFNEPGHGQCNQSPMFAIKHAGITDPTRVIFAYNPNTPTGNVNCRGATVPLQINDPNFNDWVCLATRAFDRAGNRAISAPLRLCVDGDPGNGVSCETLDEPPSCLGSCTLKTFGSAYDADGAGPYPGGPKDIPSDVYRTVVY